MTHGLKLFLMAASTIITLMVVTVAINLASQSKKIETAYSDQVKDFYNDLDESGIVMYDGTIVYGSDVVNLLKKVLYSYTEPNVSPLSFTIVSKGKTYIYNDNRFLDGIQNFTDEHYIKPLNQFRGKININGNDVITGITFTLQ